VRARRRALVWVVALLAAAATVLGAATGARAATTASPGGADAPGTTSTSGTGDAPSSGATLGSRTLRRGMHGADVRALQGALRVLGFRVVADGAFGVRTARNVRRYERTKQLQVDGIVDPAEGAQIAQDAGSAAGTGAADSTASPGTAPAGPQATLNPDGTATAPAGAPPAVQQIIAAGNQIAHTPYEYGGGHTDDFQDTGYDCSGSVSFALHGAGLLSAALDSSGFMRWGDRGKGEWVTIYGNPGHAYMVVAGLRFDTSARKQSGSRWTETMRSSRGYRIRHPEGL
jgi:peptidoglycan hydrolase-like protein with peptidoglycan-binding domain